jgi:hypothetical protein
VKSFEEVTPHYAALLRQLLTRLTSYILNALEHPDVLTKPMDAGADGCAFLLVSRQPIHPHGDCPTIPHYRLESWFILCYRGAIYTVC